MSLCTTKYYRAAVLLTLAMAAPASAVGQQHLSAMRGTVLDPAGAPAAALRMRAVHEETGESRRFTADDQGRFVLLQLEPGVYRIRSEDDRYTGFTARVSVGVNDDREVTLPLGMGSISTDVDFRPFFRPIDEGTAAVRTRLPGSFVADIPWGDRAVLDATLFAPATASTEFGVVAAGTGAGFTGYLLDGFYNTEPLLGVAVVRPQIEAIRTLEVRRASFDASAGRTGGAQVQLVSRSGTNMVSGGAFGFLQTALDRRQFGGYAGGPLAENRTFLFGDYQHTRLDEDAFVQSPGHDLGARLDHLFGGGARLMARYGMSDATDLGRRGQHFGTSFTYAPEGPLANDVRFSVSRVAFAPIADLSGIATSQTYQLTDTVSWTRGTHLVNAGGEWYAFSRGLSSGELAAHVLSGFVQDDWHPAPTVSVSAGVRFGRVSRNDAEVDPMTFAAPRVGAAWTVGRDQETVLRAGYGRSHHPDVAFTSMPVFDHWNIAAERQVGRTRTIELAYVGSAGDDLPASGSSRYHALVAELEQRFETGLTAYVSYTLGKWTQEDFPGRRRSPFDTRHKWTGMFTWSLPIGDERRWFSRGLVGEILEDMLIAGTFATLSGQPRAFEPGDGPPWKTLNLSIAKNWNLDLQRTVQFRFETLNALNRSNPLRTFFVPEVFEPFGGDIAERRYQVGVRFISR